MTAISAPLLATGSLPQSHGTDRASLAKAAQQFEAIFVRQMLAAARKSEFGGDLLGGQGLDTFRQMQDEHFADLAAQQGSFGLGKMIEGHLAAQLDAGASTSSAGAGVGVTPAPLPAQAEPVEAPLAPTPSGRP